MMPDAEVLDGFSVQGKTAQEDPDDARETVTDWLDKNGF